MTGDPYYLIFNVLIDYYFNMQELIVQERTELCYSTTFNEAKHCLFIIRLVARTRESAFHDSNQDRQNSANSKSAHTYIP